MGRRCRWAGWGRAADPPVDQVLGCAAKMPLQVPADTRVDQVLPCCLPFVIGRRLNALCDHDCVKSIHFIPPSLRRVLRRFD